MRESALAGYRFEVQVRDCASSAGNKAALRFVCDFVFSSFPGATLDEEHVRRARFRLPLTSLSLSKAFGLIESNVVRLGIEDYSLSQSTLENVFMSFARQQTRRVVDKEEEEVEKDEEGDVEKGGVV